MLARAVRAHGHLGRFGEVGVGVDDGSDSEQDDPLLSYIQEEGLSIEPEYYVPVIPMVLVNGTKGIGTGFSTDIMCYNPTQIINKLELMLKKQDHDIDITIYSD